MKYFDKLPKRTFETTLGSFSISDYFSYYKFSFDLVNKREFEFDSKTTLVEAASTLYEDPNSFWLILLANQTINPFLLFVDNYTDYIQNNQYKSTAKIGNQAGPTGYYMSAGSLVLPYSATGGKPFDFNYVGNFSLDGNIYIVEDQDSYTKRVTMKPTPTNGVPIIDDPTFNVQYVDFESPTTLQSSTETPIVASDVYSYLDTVEAIEDSGPVGSLLFKNMLQADVPNVYSPTSSQQSEQTYQEAAQYANRKVNIFNPSELSKVTSRLITIKYT
jgi:hypothetical protein